MGEDEDRYSKGEGETFESAELACMGISHREKEFTSAVDVGENIGVEMTGQSIDDKVTVVFTQKCLRWKTRKVASRTHPSEQRSIIEETIGKRKICVCLSDPIPLQLERGGTEAFGQIFLPGHKDQSVHTISLTWSDTGSS